MFCRKCGAKLEETSKFCPSCGIEVKKDNPQQTVEKKSFESELSPEELKSARIMTILSVILTFFAGIPGSFITYFSSSTIDSSLSILIGLCPLIGLVLLIVTRVKYPKYTPAKVVMWIYIIFIISAIIGFILLAALCYMMCSGCSQYGY